MGIFFLIPPFVCLLLFAFGLVIIAVQAISQSRALSLGRRISLWCKLLGVGVFVLCSFVGIAGAAIHFWYGHKGKSDGDRYYLVSHGDYTEVSEEVWDFVAKTEYVLLACWLAGSLGLATFFFVGLLEKRRVVTSLAEGFDLPDAQQ